MRYCANGKGLVSGTFAVVDSKPGALIPCAIWDGDVDRPGKHLRMIFDESGVFVLTYPTVHDNHCIPGIECSFANDDALSLVLYHAAAMPTLATPNPPSRNPSAKKRKYDQLDPPPPPLPPNGFVLYIALDALPPAKRRCGVLDYRWTLLLAPEDKPETHGRQYLIREISPKIDPRDGPGSSKGLGIPGRGFEEPGLEQQRRRVERFLASTPSEDTDHGNSRSRTSACNHPERHESGYSCRGSRT